MSDYLAAAVLLIGAFFMLVAGVGLIRLPDVYSRMHAATKATTFGMGGILSAVILFFQAAHVATHAILAIFFLFLTAPVAAHLIARAAYRKGPGLAPATRLDEYGPYLAGERSTSQTKNGINAHD
ncbi:MAG: monovalent cation/H(+) antiporter subunit G [Candidatus Tectomicrobia bacterium]|nr:monovalent cation/H(+) antiporter subunit G [Candidatus Tectomicrobia bacterium]